MQKYSFIYEGRVYNFKEQHLKGIVFSETKKLVSEAYKPKFEALDRRYGNLLNESKYRIVYNLRRENLQEAFMDTVKNLASKAWSAIKSGAGKLGDFFKKHLNKPTVAGMHLAGANIGKGIGAILASPIAIGKGIASAFKELSVLDQQKQELVKAEIPKIVDEVSKTKDEASSEAVFKKKEEALTKAGLTPDESKKIIDGVKREVSKAVITKAAELSAKTGGNLSANLETALKSPQMAKYKLEDAEKTWIATNVLEPMKNTPSAQKVFLLEAEVAAVDPNPAPAAAPAAKPTPTAPTAKSSAKPATRLSVELSKKLIADKTLQPLQKTKIKNFLSAWVKTQKGTVEDRFSKALFDAGIGVKGYGVAGSKPASTTPATSVPAANTGEAPAASTTAKPPPPPADADDTEETASAQAADVGGGKESKSADGGSSSTAASTPESKVAERIKTVTKEFPKNADLINQISDEVAKALAGKLGDQSNQITLTENQKINISNIIKTKIKNANLNPNVAAPLYKAIILALKGSLVNQYSSLGIAAVNASEKLKESKQVYTKKGNMFVLNG